MFRMLLQLLQEMLTLIGGIIVFYFVYIFFTRKNDKPAADTPSMAHAALRELVERAVDEARKLPGLGESVTIRRQDNTSISEQSYEDLLAAAILNKVVEKYQKGRVDGNSNVVRETTSKRCRHRESEASVSGADEASSLDPMSQDECGSDCSRTKAKLHIRQEPLSLTIEEQIEEVTTTYTSDEEPRNVKENALHFRNAKRVPFPEFGMDIVDPSQDSSEDSEDEVDACVSVDHVTPLETWEQNWLFQRKKLAAQPEPVAMLVPNPSEDYRALIGDKDADDMSDLSEFSAQSDEEVDEDLIEAINQVPASPKVLQAPSGVQKTKSAILHDNFTGEIVCEKSDDVETVNRSSPGPKIESEIVKEERNCTEDLKFNDTETEVTGEEGKYSSEDRVKNTDIKEDRNKIPRTPTATPTRNSLCENDPALPTVCDLRKLNEKLIAIDDSDSNKDNVVENHGFHSSEFERQLELEKSEKFLHKVEQNEDTLKNARSPLENVQILNNAPACQAAVAAAKVRGTSSIEKKSNEEGHELSAPPRPGTIAEREHRKWENAVPIQNNPYSEENIQKRLLERQYARRSSDATGSGVLPSSPSPPLKIVLGGNRPDVQRFARDYYINEAKSPTGERHRRSGTSNSSRPSSSLSQNSASTSSDYEHQESFELIEPSSKSQNNRETGPQEVIEEILERERKNSKNEINAKLNNQGNFDSSLFDGKKSFADENNRKIRRIDLKAYGFANQFNESNEIRKKPPRVVNKLDLRSYGYDSGLRRTQSNNHIDSKANNSLVHPKTIADKSNLMQNESVRLGGGDYIWTQSTEDLTKEKQMIFDKLGGMTVAKSVPNIAKISSFSYTGNRNSDDDFEMHVTRQVNNSRDNGVDSYDSDSQNSRTESAEELPRKLATSKEMRYSLESLEGPDRFIDADLPMPSVRRLAQAFNVPPQEKPIPVTRVNKSIIRDRPTTPEIHIVKSPRQMHSLTARSLSREFREGLRNISCKPNAQPVYSTIIEQSKVPAGSVSNESENNDKKRVIASGNLRNNIQFWEQLQRKP